MGLFTRAAGQPLADSAIAALRAGRPDLAAPDFERAAQAFVREGNAAAAATALSNLAFVRKLTGDLRGGLAAADEALRLVPAGPQRAMVLLTRAGLLDRLRDPTAQEAWLAAAQAFSQQPGMQLSCRAHAAGAAIAQHQEDGFALARDAIGQLGPCPTPALLVGLLGAIGESAGGEGTPYFAHAMLVIHRHMDAFNSSNAPHWVALVERVGVHTQLGLGLGALGLVAALASRGKPDHAGIMQHVDGVLGRCAAARNLSANQLLAWFERDQSALNAVRPALEQLAPSPGSLAAVSAWQWARLRAAGIRQLGIYGRDHDGACFHAVVPLDNRPDDEMIALVAADAEYRPRQTIRLGPHHVLNNEKQPPAMVAMNRTEFESGDGCCIMLLTTAERRTYRLTEL
jgi:hypothetical protein